ncbi:MAG: cyclic-di-AMP receptor [Fimbriimonas sp.]|nr:cyclic-di-AMP receptor [Fimbriimonas sp.]
MKLAVCIVHSRDKGRVTDELVKAGFKFTVIGSTGGFLREGNTTFLIGVDESELPALQKVIAQNSQSREQLVNVMPFEAAPPGAFLPSPVKVPVGGAVMFVINVEQFHRF